jgi:CRP-like cAMP-binding protein
METPKTLKPVSIHKILEEYKHLTKEISVANKTVLLREGETAKNIFFVKEGCLRMWMNYEGKEITFQFFFENEMVASIESFRSNEPGFLNIQAIEPSTLVVLRKKDFKLAFDESPQVKDFLLEMAFKRFSDYTKLYLSFLKNNPVERYKDLLLNQPRIIQRVPQHYIASYLGITPVSLSRIRNKISKQ